MELGVFAVDTDALEVFIAVMPEVAEIGHLLQEFGLGREHCPTLDGMEDLGGMEAAGRHVAVAEDRAALHLDPECMCPVVDYFELVFFCDPIDGLHITWNSIDVRGKDGGGAWGDGGFYFVRVDVAGSRVDIHKDRFASFPDDAACGRHIGKWRGDDLSGEFHGFDRNLNGDGTVAGIKQVVDTEVFLEAKLQFVDQRAVVG